MSKYNRYILIFALLISSFSFGQSAEDGFTLGLRGGIVASQVAGDGWGGFDKFGFFAGADIERKFKKNAGFEVGLQFIQKGSIKNSNPDKGDLRSYKLSLSYIELPILYKYYQGKFIYDVGLSGEFLINTKEIDNDGIELNSRDEFNDISLSLQIGMEYEIAERSYLNFRFTNSISPIRNAVALQTTQLNFWRRIFNKGQYNTLIEFGYKRLIGQ